MSDLAAVVAGPAVLTAPSSPRLPFVVAAVLALQPLEALVLAILLASRSEGKLAVVGTVGAVAVYVLYPGVVAVISNRSTRPGQVRLAVAGVLLLAIAASWWYLSSHAWRTFTGFGAGAAD